MDEIERIRLKEVARAKLKIADEHLAKIQDIIRKDNVEYQIALKRRDMALLAWVEACINVN